MDEQQFKSRILPLHRDLYAYALSILGDDEEAADCVQEAFTRLWENRARLDRIANVAAYSAVTVRHLAITMASRSAGRAIPFGDDPPDVADTGPDPQKGAEGRESVRNLASLLDSLPESQRKVVVMSAVGGLSNSEIKEATGLSDDNVRVLLSRGRKKLKILFSKLK